MEIHIQDGDSGPEILMVEDNVKVIRKRTIFQLRELRREIDAILDGYAMAAERIQKEPVALKGVKNYTHT